MIKFLFSIFILLLSIKTLAFGPIQIMATYEAQTFDLAGRDGFDGRNGANAFSADCSDGLTRNGRDGENGGNGEKGENGRDAIIYFQDLEDLKNLTLFQAGGKGGKPGLPGKGAAGCHGGAYGKKGKMGKKGSNGNYGQLFLIEKSQQFEKANTTRVLSLGEFYAENVVLSRHLWTKVVGAKNLLSKKSDVANQYFLYDRTIDYKIHFVWSASSPIWNFSNTRLALTVKNGELEVTSYSGAIIDYRITKKGDDFVFEILNAISDLEFKNLTFGKMRGNGEELLLEVKEKYRPSVRVNTRFVISIYHRQEFANGNSKDVFIGQFPVSDESIMFQDGVFYLMIGGLNFPAKYKMKDTKLRVHLSIYREANRQTRVLGIKGLFKI